jgi:hypothetical protein
VRLVRLIALATLGTVVGCYTLVPTMGAAPGTGTQVAFDVTDQGRVALGGSMGPEIAQIEGRLVEAQNGDYVVAVSSVRLLGGGTQVWSGERVRIKSDHVGRVYERRFSRGRTIAMSAVAIGGVAAFLVSRGYSIRDSGDDPPCCDTIISLRPRRP